MLVTVISPEGVESMNCRLFALFTAAVLATGCQGPESEADQESGAADIIFIGDHIITLDEAAPDAEAVAVAGQQIVAVGSIDEVLQFRTEATRVIELGERALIPGFIDAHGHMPSVGRQLELIDVSSPPVGKIENIDDIVAAVKARIESENIAPGTWVIGRGYDDSLLAEGRHPNRDDLDKASMEHPISLTHVSGHLLAVNSLALETQNVG
ncbi:MAG: putative amidohydrolase YtcJ, partial [Woeseiaceae bacterium]